MVSLPRVRVRHRVGNSNSDYVSPYKEKADQIRNDQALKDAIREAHGERGSGISLN